MHAERTRYPKRIFLSAMFTLLLHGPAFGAGVEPGPAPVGPASPASTAAPAAPAATASVPAYDFPAARAEGSYNYLLLQQACQVQPVLSEDGKPAGLDETCATLANVTKWMKTGTSFPGRDQFTGWATPEDLQQAANSPITGFKGVTEAGSDLVVKLGLQKPGNPLGACRYLAVDNQGLAPYLENGSGPLIGFPQAEALSPRPAFVDCAATPVEGPALTLKMAVKNAPNLLLWLEAGSYHYALWLSKGKSGWELTKEQSDKEVGRGSTPSISVLPGAALSSSGLSQFVPDQASILVGLTDFLLKRAEGEFKAWALQDLISQLCDEDRAPAGQSPALLLPNTCSLLKASDVSMLLGGAGALQTAARTDLTQLARGVGRMSMAKQLSDEPGVAEALKKCQQEIDSVRKGLSELGTPTSEPAKKEQQKLKAKLEGLQKQQADLEGERARIHNLFDVSRMLAVMGRVTELTLKGHTPAVALAGWSQHEKSLADLELRREPLSAMLLTSSLLLASLPIKAGVLQFPRDPDPAIFPALTTVFLYQVHTKGIYDKIRVIYDQPETPQELAVAALFRDLEPMMKALFASDGPLVQAQQAAEALKQIKAQVGTGDPDQLARRKLEAYALLVGSGMEIVQLSLHLELDAGWQTLLTPEQMKRTEGVLESMSQGSEALATGDYGQMMAAAQHLIDALVSEKGKESEAYRLASRTTSFAASLAQAQNPDAARQVIDAWAAPMGAYMRKHNGGGFYGGLTGYVGAGGGFAIPIDGRTERLNGLNSDNAAFWPSLLVGVDVGGRCGKGYYGGFVSILDLGTVATWRVKSSYESGTDQVSVTPADLKVTQVFSPGLYGVIAPWSVPVALGLGVSFAPSLVEVTTTTTDGASTATTRLSDVNVLHFGLFLAMDIPIFP